MATRWVWTLSFFSPVRLHRFIRRRPTKSFAAGGSGRRTNDAKRWNLSIARSSGTYLRYRDKLAKFDLIIFDEMGMRNFTATEAQDLCEIIEERSINKSIAFTSQLPVEHWNEVIPVAVIFDERDRYVFDEEFIAVYKLVSDMLAVAMDLATITGQREGDLLKLPCNDPRVYTSEGIIFRPNKSKRRHPRHGVIVERAKTVIVEWSDDLRAVVDRARKLGPRLRPSLICTTEGAPYTESGFRSNWHRLMTAATKSSKRKDGSWINEPVLVQPFTFHDLRAKRASDAEDLAEANEALAHDDMKTTQKVYRRKPRRARAGAKILDNSPDIRHEAN